MRAALLPILALLATGQTPAPASARFPEFPERNVVAAMQDYDYRYDVQGFQMYDIVVTIHGAVAYAYASVGVDGRGDLLRNDRGLWHVTSPAKGQFPPDVFSSLGVSPRIALIAIRAECPPLRIPLVAMTTNQRLLARHSYTGHVGARRVRDVIGHLYALAPVAYRVCEI